MAVIGGIRDPWHSERSEGSRSWMRPGAADSSLCSEWTSVLHTTAIPTQEPMKSNLPQKDRARRSPRPSEETAFIAAGCWDRSTGHPSYDDGNRVPPRE